MTGDIYLALGVVMALYALIHMTGHSWFKPSFKQHWRHYTVSLLSVVVAWPLWLIVGFITYIIETVPKKDC